MNKDKRHFLTPINGKPTEVDIICGRGRGISHPGNIKFLKEIEINMHNYSDAFKRKAKSQVVDRVLYIVKSRGARFVKKEGEVWYAIGEEGARAKVAHSIRDFFTRWKREYQSKEAMKQNPKRPRTAAPFNKVQGEETTSSKPPDPSGEETLMQSPDWSPCLLESDSEKTTFLNPPDFC